MASACREHETPDRGNDGGELGRHSRRGSILGSTLDAGEHHDWHLVHVIREISGGVDQFVEPLAANVTGCIVAEASRVMGVPRAFVKLADRLASVGISDHDEMPRLSTA